MKTLVLLIALSAVAYGSYDSKGRGQAALHKPATLPGQRYPGEVHRPQQIPGRVPVNQGSGGYGGRNTAQNNNYGFNNGYNRPVGGQNRPLIPNQQPYGAQQRPGSGYNNGNNRLAYNDQHRVTG